MKLKIDRLPEIIEQIQADTHHTWKTLSGVLGTNPQMLLLYRKKKHEIPTRIAKQVQKVFKIKLFVED